MTRHIQQRHTHRLVSSTSHFLVGRRDLRVVVDRRCRRLSKSSRDTIKRNTLRISAHIRREVLDTQVEIQTKLVCGGGYQLEGGKLQLFTNAAMSPLRNLRREKRACDGSVDEATRRRNSSSQRNDLENLVLAVGASIRRYDEKTKAT